MFRPILGHFVAMPFLIGFVPWMTKAAFDAQFLGLVAIGLLWMFGPIARRRTAFIVEKKFGLGDFIRLLFLVMLACMAGTSVGGFVFTPPPVY